MAVTTVAFPDKLRATNLIAHGHFVNTQIGNAFRCNGLPQASQRPRVDLERMNNSFASHQVQRKHAVVSNVGAYVQENVPRTKYLFKWQKESRVEFSPHKNAAAYRRAEVDEHGPAGMDAAFHRKRPAGSGSKADSPKRAQYPLSRARLE